MNDSLESPTPPLLQWTIEKVRLCSRLLIFVKSLKPDKASVIEFLYL